MSALHYPEDLHYSKEHTWLREADDGTALVGISDFAQDQLGEVAFVDLPAVGKLFASNGEFGTVESIKAVNALYMPVAGTVLAVNPALAADPSLVNTSPYADGWMIKIQIPADADRAFLLNAADYKAGLE